MKDGDVNGSDGRTKEIGRIIEGKNDNLVLIRSAKLKSGMSRGLESKGGEGFLRNGKLG